MATKKESGAPAMDHAAVMAAWQAVMTPAVGFWMDSFGSGLVTNEGIGKPEDGAFNLFSTGLDAMGKAMRVEYTRK